MKTTFLILFVLVPFSLVQAQSFSNLDFEYWQRNKYPLFWHLNVGNTQSTMKATGAWLKETFGDKYYIVGTCYFDGTDSYKKNALRNSASVINESVKGSYEYLFNQIDRDCFFLDLKQVGKHDSLSNKWLTAPMLMRDYGVEPFNYYHEFSLVDITSQFDGIMFVKRSIPL